MPNMQPRHSYSLAECFPTSFLSFTEEGSEHDSHCCLGSQTLSKRCRYACPVYLPGAESGEHDSHGVTRAFLSREARSPVRFTLQVIQMFSSSAFRA